MRNFIKIKFLVIFAIFISSVFLVNKVHSASIGAVENINEKKYPGFKEKIKILQQTYPNIQILYTGLDWNTVIYNETSAAHGRNLVSVDMPDEWICQQCKKNGILYDSGLYCASKEAVEYVMDPRNYLTTRDVFQFQKLNTPVGTTEKEIKTVLQYQNVTYLQNDSAAIKAFAQVATKNSLNAYHLITRIIQEQGRSGNSTLSSGLGYTGNGYTNYGYGYYNLFSIGATKKSLDPAYKIYLNALDRAAIEGWTTRALSISGGGNFVGNKYIDVGQNTLYLQKFAVYNTNGQLYWHQYMQNLFAAQNEARILYKCYQATGIQNSKDFEFLIPVYENMPQKVSAEPTKEYDGYVTSAPYTNIKLNGKTITGKLVIQEWLNGTKQIEPATLPKVVLKDENGVQVIGELKYIEPYVYEFKFDLNSINKNLKYEMEVQCTNSYNISTHKNVVVKYADTTIGKIEDYTIKYVNSKIVFEEIDNRYDGYMTNSPYTKITSNGNIMTGRLVIQEWLNGTKQIEPTSLPKVILKAENGVEIIGTLKYIEPYVYEFKFDLSYIDKALKYEMEVQCTNPYNISTHKDVVVEYADTIIGKIENYTMKYINSKIVFEEIDNRYDGYMTNSPYTQITLNGNIMTGRLVIQEWLNGTKQIEPTNLPKVVLKAENGTEIVGTLRYIEPYVYEFKFDLSNINKALKYEMEVQCTNPYNTSTHKDVVVKYTDTIIGKIENYTMKYVNNKIVFEEIDNRYDGYMTSAPYTNIKLNGNIITGKLVIQEWLNGTKQIEPTTLPKVVLKAENGVEVVGTLKYIEPYVYEYSFNRAKLELGSYIFEVNGTNPNNISTHQIIKIDYIDQFIGTSGNIKYEIRGGKLIITR